jgi:rRNA maturation RNase YbeY
MQFSVSNTTKGKHPRLPFARLKDHVLGPEYELSLVFVGTTRSRALNKKYRGKDYPANVLSFPLGRDAGEIFIDLSVARKQAPQYRESYTAFVAHLFIHGMFHLKGFAHGSKMEKKEKEVRTLFSV